MILPKLVYKLVSIFLAGLVFFSSSTAVFANHQSVPVPHSGSQSQAAPTYYKIVPIPPPSSGQNVVPIPPPSTQSPQVLQANFITDLAGKIGDVLTLIGEVAWGGIKTAFGPMVSAAVYVTEQTLLSQTAGTVANAVLDTFSYDDPVEAMERFQDIARDPNAYGTTGAIGVFEGVNESLLALSMPVSTSTFLASVNPFPTASAQDGAAALSSSYNNIILHIWQRARDASLALMVAALVIIGFMIMLRWRTGPRTSVTVQNALPRIALALLLIWFSFGISGLMLDLIRVLANIVNSFFFDINLTSIVKIVSLFVLAALTIWALTTVSGLFTWLGVALIIIVLLLLLIMSIIILYVYAVIIYKLLTRYVIFLVLTMFAPFFFLVGAIPGMEGAIYNWFKRALAALIAIPATGLVIKLAYAIGIGTLAGSEINEGAYESLKTGSTWGLAGLDLIGGTLGGALSWIVAAPVVGLGLFFFATKVPDMVDELFRTGLGGGHGRGGGFGGIIGMPLGAFQTAGNVGRAWSGTQGMREATGRFLARSSAIGPRPRQEEINPVNTTTGKRPFVGGQPLRHLAPDRLKELEQPLRQAGAIFTDASGVERIKTGTTIDFAAEPRGGIVGAAARTASRVVGRGVGMEKPPYKVIVRTPEQDAMKKGEEAAVPGDKTRRDNAF